MHWWLLMPIMVICIILIYALAFGTIIFFNKLSNNPIFFAPILVLCLLVGGGIIYILFSSFQYALWVWLVGWFLAGLGLVLGIGIIIQVIKAINSK